MYNLTDLSVGMAISTSVVFDEFILEDFKRMSSDSANVHIDEFFAQNLGYKSKLVHGLLVQMPISSLVGMQLPGPNSVLVEISSKFHSPTYIDNEVDYSVQITKIMESQRLVQLRFAGKVEDRIVISGNVTTVFPEKTVK
jgi:3-hydroxybutyryl-CoA dehydratase